MATSVEEIEEKKKQVEIPPTRRDYFTIPEFRKVRSLLPDYELELINGEITLNKRSPLQSISIADFKKVAEEFPDHRIELIDGETSFFDVPDRFREPDGSGADIVCPDASVYYNDYFDTDRRPPALLIVEVLSFSNRQHLKRDLELKRAIYAALEVPAYWVIDRRDKSVLAHTDPRDGGYVVCVVCEKIKDDRVLPAPGLDFLQITPAQIYGE